MKGPVLKKFEDAKVSSGSSHDEKALIDRCLKGDGDAFEALIKPYLPRMESIARKYAHQNFVFNKADADDLLQESLLRVYKGLESFKGNASFYTWVYRVTNNICINYTKKQSRRLGDLVFHGDVDGSNCNEGGTVDDLHLYPTNKNLFDSQNPELLAERDETSEILSNAFNKLEEEHKEMARSYFMENFDPIDRSYQEAADILGVRPVTVANQQRRSKKKMSRYVEMFGGKNMGCIIEYIMSARKVHVSAKKRHERVSLHLQ